MDCLIFLDAKAGELEKILSGVKTMIVLECGAAGCEQPPLKPGDSLYFLRDTGEKVLRVVASVVSVVLFTGKPGEELSQTLKEVQARLKLTEAQYRFWAAKQQAVFVEFGSARKIPAIEIEFREAGVRSGWATFE